MTDYSVEMFVTFRGDLAVFDIDLNLRIIIGFCDNVVNKNIIDYLVLDI